jgi:hypothetical protein
MLRQSDKETNAVKSADYLASASIASYNSGISETQEFIVEFKNTYLSHIKRFSRAYLTFNECLRTGLMREKYCGIRILSIPRFQEPASTYLDSTTAAELFYESISIMQDHTQQYKEEKDVWSAMQMTLLLYISGAIGKMHGPVDHAHKLAQIADPELSKISNRWIADNAKVLGTQVSPCCWIRGTENSERQLEKNLVRALDEINRIRLLYQCATSIDTEAIPALESTIQRMTDQAQGCYDLLMAGRLPSERISMDLRLHKNIIRGKIQIEQLGMALGRLHMLYGKGLRDDEILLI